MRGCANSDTGIVKLADGKVGNVAWVIGRRVPRYRSTRISRYKGNLSAD